MDDHANNIGLMDSASETHNLVGTNRMEILLFSLGTKEIFGINVFKVREVCYTPPVTKTPNMPQGVEGVISLRGNIIPVISLAKFANLDGVPEDTGHTMIVTEFSRHTQAFLVHDVDHIIRVDWEKMKAPQAMLSGNDGLITAITELPDGRLVSILDVEQILAKAIGVEFIPDLAPAQADENKSLFVVDDSAVARKEIISVLDKLEVKYQTANNGAEAWKKLQDMANRAQQEGSTLSKDISIILTDAEMPEMDGYVLTKNIKNDVRFKDIPVIMHSSLSSEANRVMGKNVGVDAYVAKFDPMVLADTLRPFLNG